jgi:MFS transporter, UMF1 family
MQNEISTPLVLNDKRVTNGWAFFDCANSAYSLVIAVAIFPVYFKATAPKIISFLGMDIPSSAILAYAVTIAYGVIALSSPVLSGIADYGGKRKYFQQFFTTIGALACIAMFWLTNVNDWHIGFWAYVLATVGYAGGIVFNNSFLPIIASEDQFDKLSARGYTYGYIGSVFLLLVNLVMILFYDKFGFTDISMPSRISFVMVGLWWLGFAQIPRKRLPADSTAPLSKNAISMGWKEFKDVFQAVKANDNLKKFLLSYFFFDAGVQTVLFMAAVYADDLFHLPQAKLIGLILLLQIVAAVGAWLFAKVSAVKGNKWSIILMLIVWFFVCCFAFIVNTEGQFYVLSTVLGAVMGGIQSLSRSTYSKLIPENTTDITSFFSFFDVTDKVAVVVGTFAFGIVNQLTGDIRYSALSLTLFFIAGLVLMRGVKIRDTNVGV